jgi:hypothetical protein
MSNFNSSVYFGTPVWTNNVPEFIKPLKGRRRGIN